MNFITLDCGASYLKAGLYDGDGKILMEKSIASPKIENEEDNILKPKQLLQLLKCVEELVEEFTCEEESIGLSISNEMHGFVLADEKGVPFCDYISWQKEYGKKETPLGTPLERLKKDCSEYIWKSGMPLRAGLPSVNLFYFYCQGILNKNHKFYFYTLGDYILRYLTGRIMKCHPSNAAATGLFDLLTNDWNKELIKYIGCENLYFPEVGEDKVEFEYKGKKYVTVPAIGDYQAALLGAGMKEKNTVSYNLGTGAQVSIVLDEISQEILKKEDCQICPFFENLYLKRIAHIPSGRALNVYVRFYKDILDVFGVEASEDLIWQRMLETVNADKEQGKKLKIDLSFFENAVSSQKGGSISDIGEYELTFKGLSDSVLWQVANNFINCADCIFPEKEKVEHLIITGGIARRIRYITDMVVNHYNRDVDVKIPQGETGLGCYKHIVSVLEAEK